MNIDKQNPSQTVKLGKHLCDKRKAELTAFLRKNLDVFAWSHEDMIGIRPSVIMHTLHLDKSIPAKSQKQRRLGTTRAEALEEVARLKKCGFIREAKFPIWVANPVLVPKPNGK